MDSEVVDKAYEDSVEEEVKLYAIIVVSQVI